MITLNVQIGVNPLSNHRPLWVYRHPACRFCFTVGENGQIVAWDQQCKPVFEMCPSVNAEADKLLVLTAARLRAVEKAKTVVRLITIHNDNRLRIWSQDDGICLNVSTPQLFPEPIITILAAPIESKFVIAIAEQHFYIVDLWLLKIVGMVTPKKEGFARFRGGRIDQNLKLEIFDNCNRSYYTDLTPIFAEHFLDFGNYIADFPKISKQIDQACRTISQSGVKEVFNKQEPVEIESVQQFKKKIKQETSEDLAHQIFSPELIKDYPALEQLMKDEQACISTLHYVAGSALFLWVGTQNGKLWGIPMSVKSDQDIVLVCQASRQGHPISYVRIFGGNLFVSWEDGWLGIYAVQNLTSYLQMAKINRVIEKKQGCTHEVITIGLQKLKVHEERLSSFIKYSLPTYQRDDAGLVRGTYFFRLDRNEIIRYQEGNNHLIHYRGISEQTKVYCVMLLQEYVCICTDKGVEAYSSIGYQRTITYQDWIWADFECLQDIKQTFEYRHSDMGQSIGSASGLLKYNSRWFFDLLDYYLHGENILIETFGAPARTNNQDFPGYYFMQRGEVQKAFHSRSNDNFCLVIKMKLNRVRRDNWNNAAFIVHGNLNAQLDSFLMQRGKPTEIVNKDYEFYQLLPWEQIPVPFLTKQMKSIGKRVTLKRRWTAQGVGKGFTIYFKDSRFKLSSRMLAHEAISAIALLQCWVVKDNEMTDHMVEAVEYFARLISSLYADNANVVLSKLAVSECQHISKATINLLISKAHTSKVTLSPLLEYFLMNSENQRLLTYNQTSWVVYLGLGLLYSTTAVQTQQKQYFVQRLVSCIKDISNYQQKPHYLLTVMRVLNQGVSQWHDLLIHIGLTSIFSQLFLIFFYLDGLVTVAPDDKRFNFCFASIDEPLRKVLKQGVIKTLIYLAKQFGAEFHGMLKGESVHQKIHPYYPASVIEVLRQYIKSQRPQNHLVFYVQLLLQCLSPMTPQLRKYVQKNALTTLQLLCTYSNVSFNQPSQRLSVKTQNHLYIYCLRTSTKWRTINLKQQRISPQSIVEMSPKGTYIALLSDKLRIWRLSSGFWSGVLGAFSQDSSYEASGKGLKWDQNQSTITVINDNPALNTVIKV